MIIGMLAFWAGMIVGGILNLVATYLPRHMHRNYERQCAIFLKIDQSQASKCVTSREVSLRQCPHCEEKLPFYVVFPFMRAIFLKEKCQQCGRYFGYRYLIVEIIVGIISAWVVVISIFSWKMPLFLIFSWMLILLAVIDHEHYLLPDVITYPLLWLGLFANTFHLFVSLEQAVLGAICGYLLLFCVAQIFKYIRGVEGLGLGDCKLFALLGAWWGVEALSTILLLSSAIGSIIHMPKIFLKKSAASTYIAFGPYLAVSGILTILLQ